MSNIFLLFMCVIVGFTTVDKLEVFFYIDFAVFLIYRFCFSHIPASSPQGGAAFDSKMRILKERPRHNISVQ